jgi:hypothetical protein
LHRLGLKHKIKKVGLEEWMIWEWEILVGLEAWVEWVAWAEWVVWEVWEAWVVFLGLGQKENEIYSMYI